MDYGKALFLKTIVQPFHTGRKKGPSVEIVFFQCAEQHAQKIRLLRIHNLFHKTKLHGFVIKRNAVGPGAANLHPTGIEKRFISNGNP